MDPYADFQDPYASHSRLVGDWVDKEWKEKWEASKTVWQQIHNDTTERVSVWWQEVGQPVDAPDIFNSEGAEKVDPAMTTVLRKFNWHSAHQACVQYTSPTRGTTETRCKEIWNPENKDFKKMSKIKVSDIIRSNTSPSHAQSLTSTWEQQRNNMECYIPGVCILAYFILVLAGYKRFCIFQKSVRESDNPLIVT
eukprot:gnl/MRDRNA2_/MRDRNA2_29921_c0_seq1.p1 gnl/MRDRNA2_/MRDRNA2_29921_c0~~gnl/MRDRNA2_/MRDRNA2_29921_c0_seq1.p1  ORF type:complete len:195 (-),score=27.30 gnl/MRDRNA2_/MRDRNA2_29921_c0_seq1:249-833(-)